MLAAVGALAAACAEAGEAHLVRFTAERSVLLAGGHPTPDCFTVLTAEIAPAAEGAEVAFAIAEGTGRGRTAPAMLSRGRALTDGRGIAETYVLSSDTDERCTVRASTAEGGALEVSLEFRRTLAGTKIDASIATAPPHARRPAPAHRWAAALAAQLADPSVEVRTAVKRTLLTLGRDAVGALVEVAADPRVTPDARRLAARTLAEMRAPEADDELLALLGHPLPDVRAGAEEALSMMSTDRAGPLAEAALLSGSPSVRASGVRVLGRLGTERAWRAIETALADPDPLVRATAVWESARAADYTGRQGIEDLLARALDDEETFVRVSAAKAVVLLGGIPGLRPNALDERLERALESPEPGLRSAAVKAVALREPSAQTALVPLFMDPDERVRLSVALALTWRADPRSSLRHLRVFARDRAPAVREAALRAIAESGTEAEADVMIEMLASGDPAMTALGVRALQRVTCLDFGWYEARTDGERVEIVRRWREWWDANGDLSREAWLRQALDLPGSKLRGAAGLELVRLAPLAPTNNGLGQGDGALRKKRRRLAAALAEVVKSRHAAERHAAAEALLLLGESSGLEPLEADLADARMWVRLGAVKVVASVVDFAPDGSPEGPRPSFPDRVVRGAARLLISALEDRSVSVRRAAARALEGLVGEGFGYAPRAPSEHRARAVRRWRLWLEALPSTGAE